MRWLFLIFSVVATACGVGLAHFGDNLIDYGTSICCLLIAGALFMAHLDESLRGISVEPGLDIAAFARRHRVRFVRKDRSRLMRVLGRVLPKAFMELRWTTVGRTVYYPTFLIEFDKEQLFRYLAKRYRIVIEHELYHVLQHRRLWYLHELLYLLGLPLPFLLAWYRWRVERVAYLHQLRHYPKRAMGIGGRVTKRHGRVITEAQVTSVSLVRVWSQVDGIVNKLWRHYGWCWPRSCMRRWFRRELRGPGYGFSVGYEVKKDEVREG